MFYSFFPIFTHLSLSYSFIVMSLISRLHIFIDYSVNIFWREVTGGSLTEESYKGGVDGLPSTQQVKTRHQMITGLSKDIQTKKFPRLVST